MSDWSGATAPSGQRFVFAESGDGPLVVFLHGFPDTPHGWDRIATAVAAAGYRTIRPWLRGYHPDTLVAGRGYDPLTTAHDPVDLLDALGVDRAVLVGHDWGAGVTYGASSVAPERFRAIVPIAIPHPSLLPRDPGTLWAARHFAGFKMPWAEAMTRRNDFAYLDTLYKRWAPNWDGPLRDESLRGVKECFREPTSLTGAIAYYRALSARMPRELARPADVRALVVGGTEDIVPGELFAKTAERMADGSESFVIERAGHWPHREGEDEFIAKLISFLAAAPD
jgi:pimeloyl-ACP methyl ester carboxylesterase